MADASDRGRSIRSTIGGRCARRRARAASLPIGNTAAPAIPWGALTFGTIVRSWVIDGRITLLRQSETVRTRSFSSKQSFAPWVDSDEFVSKVRLPAQNQFLFAAIGMTLCGENLDENSWLKTPSALCRWSAPRGHRTGPNGAVSRQARMFESLLFEARAPNLVHHDP